MLSWELIAVAAGQLALATALGGLVGLEREVTHHAAGFRTHILVCVGSTLVMMTGAFVFEQYVGRASVDPTRLGAQVVSGIGFLGAGAILREGINVRGLTTAASLWMVGCIGLAVGAGYYMAAVAATLFTFLTLTALRTLSEKIERRYGRVVVFELRLGNEPDALGELTRLLSSHAVSIQQIAFHEGDSQSLTIRLKLPFTLTQIALLAILDYSDCVSSVTAR